MHSPADVQLQLSGMLVVSSVLAHTALTLVGFDTLKPEQHADLFLVMQALVVVLEILPASAFLPGILIVLIYDMAGEILLPERKAPRYTCGNKCQWFCRVLVTKTGDLSTVGEARQSANIPPVRP